MDSGQVPDIDVTRPHPARIYDYGLGGKDNFAADREVADKILAAVPTIRTAMRENRAFMRRAVRFLAAEAGIRQFLDIGTGMPTTGSVHEIAQQVAPETRVVYSDNDPLVLAHARALLTSTPQGRTGYVHADVREPQSILTDPVTRDLLDFTQPIALMLVGLLHFLTDDDDPAGIIATLLAALPPGSYLAASHVSAEHTPPEAAAEGLCAYRASGLPFQPRDCDAFARMAFGGLELVPPGVVIASEWRPSHDGPRPSPSEVGFYGGVARLPGPPGSSVTAS